MPRLRSSESLASLASLASSAASPRESREARIVSAATELFRRAGVRGTTMEAIAREAGVAKATAYAYFPDKEAVFRAVCQQVASRVREGVTAALAAGGPVEARVSAALLAKFGLVFELVYGSPHAADILASSDAHAKALFEQLDAEVERQLEGVVQAASRAREIELPAKARARDVAELLFWSADGLAGSAPSRSALDERVRLLVRAVLRASAG